MKRVLITSVLMMAFGFGTASEVQAQIVYGYSSSASDGGVMSPPASMNYGSYQGYSPYAIAYDSGNYSSGSRYSPVSIYVSVPTYPPIGPNYRLSPVRKYGSSMYGTGSGFGGSYTGMPVGMSPTMFNPYSRLTPPFWMRHR